MKNLVANSSNPFRQTNNTWLVEFIIENNLIIHLEAELETLSATQSMVEIEDTNLWLMQLYFDVCPDLDKIEQFIANILGSCPKLSLTIIDDIDWVKEVQKNFPPLNIGKFFIYGSHYKGALPVSKIKIIIDAARAFGTGEHATTTGCLQAISYLHRKYKFDNILDVGTGTGILAIAASKAFKAKVVAIDIDYQAVKISHNNILINQSAKYISCFASNGYDSINVKKNAKYDLIIANILAKPLKKMARNLKNNLRDSGIAVLSGLLVSQERLVLSAHHLQGLKIIKILRINGWSTLILSL
jgi:ribosomal protein L11 methyltransferase